MARKFRKKYSFIATAIVLISGVLINHFKPKNDVTLINCIDGDTATFKVENKSEKVRFLAIDTPEIAKDNVAAQPYGNEAKQYTCNALKNAKKIHLEYEKEKYDRHGRLLAWVFVDGNLLNEQLVKEGLAKVAYLYGKYTYTNVVKQAEKHAQTNKKNIWR